MLEESDELVVLNFFSLAYLVETGGLLVSRLDESGSVGLLGFSS